MFEDIKAYDRIKRFRWYMLRLGCNLYLCIGKREKLAREAMRKTFELEVCHFLPMLGQIEGIDTQPVTDTKNITAASFMFGQIFRNVASHAAFEAVAIPHNQLVKKSICLFIEPHKFLAPDIRFQRYLRKFPDNIEAGPLELLAQTVADRRFVPAGDFGNPPDYLFFVPKFDWANQCRFFAFTLTLH